MKHLEIGTQKYGLILIQRLPNRIFRCRCIYCGNETYIKGNKFGVTKSCGCRKHPQGKDSVHFTGYEEISGRRWHSIVRNAKVRDIELSISIEYAWHLFIKQNRCCALTGQELIFGKNSSTNTASLDRKNNTLGYVLDNVQWVHKNINKIKMDISTKEFVELCRKVVNYDNR